MLRVVITTIERVVGELDTLNGADLLPPSDIAYIESVTAQRRRDEIRAWRWLLRQTLLEMGYKEDSRKEINYNRYGAPYLAGSQLHFSVSHSRSHVAIIISDKACAIDIESLDRNFDRASARYITNAERDILASANIETTLHLPLAWSTKETLYKLSGHNSLDLLSDLRIVGASANTIIGEILDSEPTTMSWQTTDRHMVVTTL